MSFDLSTAQPVSTGFDLASAKPVGAPTATMTQKVISSVPARFAIGAADPALGINALYDKVVGDTGQYITSAAGYFPNAVSDWFGQAAKSGQTINNQEDKAINDARTANGARPGSTDWARLTGNLLSPANAALAPEAGAGIGAKIATGLAVGGSQPVDTNGAADPSGAAYTGRVLANTAIGGATSGVLGSLGSKAKTAETLRRAAQVKALQAYGVQPSIGQQVGGNAGQIEEQVGSIPVAGWFAKNAQVTRPTQELNRGTYADVLSSLGDKVPTDLAIGRPSVEYVNRTVNDAYNEVLPKLSLPIANVQKGMDDVLTDATTLPADQQKQLGAWTQKIVGAARDGTIPGKALKGVTSDLRKKAFSLASDPSSDARDLGQHLFDLHDVIMDAAKAANPDVAPALADADAAYTKLVRLNRAAGSVGATDGVFTPAQLSSAILSSVSKRLAAKASGNLPMQGIGDAAQSILTAKTKNSGTPERALLASALGIGIAHPGIIPQVAAAVPPIAAAYSREGQRVLGNLLTGPSLADALRKYAPNAAPYISSAAANSGPYASRGATALAQ